MHHSDLSLCGLWLKKENIFCRRPKTKLFFKEMWSILLEKVTKSLLKAEKKQIKMQMRLKHIFKHKLCWFWIQCGVFLYNMPMQTPLNVCESCGAEKNLCYWADGWRLESFSSGGSKVNIADRWVMTALQKAIYSAVAGRSWPGYTALCSCLLCHAVILSWLAKNEKSGVLLPCMQMVVW